eukprot:TRINITY_DN16966_c0_g1_i1.p1 TRINITY_DN16966_c0_g1~~TRINITY_DN16966_c0_g1_i1.p1  ORF type:complete len:1001 (+),score=242.94 TRINITY_DN16966_c0_g1_i1:83-3085(+)
MSIRPRLKRNIHPMMESMSMRSSIPEQAIPVASAQHMAPGQVLSRPPISRSNQNIPPTTANMPTVFNPNQTRPIAPPPTGIPGSHSSMPPLATMPKSNQGIAPPPTTAQIRERQAHNQQQQENNEYEYVDQQPFGMGNLIPGFSGVPSSMLALPQKPVPPPLMKKPIPPPSTKPKQQIVQEEGNNNINKQLPRPDFSRDYIKYTTGNRQIAPPQAYSNFSCIDNDGCNPRYMRCTYNHIPSNEREFREYRLPLALIVEPFAKKHSLEKPIPVIKGREVARCEHCRAFINTFCALEQGVFTCSLCRNSSSLSSEYNSYGRDPYSLKSEVGKYELSCGAYDIELSEEEERTFSKHEISSQPRFVFLIEATASSLESGMLKATLEGLKESLKSLPDNPETRVAICTYGSKVSFWKCGNSGPGMVVMNSPTGAFGAISPNQFFIDPFSQEAELLELIEEIPVIIEKQINKIGEIRSGVESTVFGNALSAVRHVVRDYGARIMCFFHRRTEYGSGSTSMREDPEVYGSPKEAVLLSPDASDVFWNCLAQDCAEHRICVDMYFMNHHYVDASTLLQVVQLTGGDAHHLPDFDGRNRNMVDFLKDSITHTFERNFGMDVTLKIRISQGLRVSNFVGSFYSPEDIAQEETRNMTKFLGFGKEALKTPESLDIAQMDQDKSIVAELEYCDEMINSKEGVDSRDIKSYVYVQSSVLYTNPFGKRCIRVFTTNYKIWNMERMVWKFFDESALFTVLLKKGIDTIKRHGHDSFVEEVNSRLVFAMSTYRNTSSAPTHKMIVPESLKSIFVLCNSLPKHPGLAKNHVNEKLTIRHADSRAIIHHQVLSATANHSIRSLYPQLYNCSNLKDMEGVLDSQGRIELPNQLPASSGFLSDGVFVFADGFCITVVLNSCNNNMYRQLLNCESFDSIRDNMQVFHLPKLQNEASTKIWNIITRIRNDYNKPLPVRAVHQMHPGRRDFVSRLIEDKMYGHVTSVAFVRQIHQTLVNRSSY